MFIMLIFYQFILHRIQRDNKCAVVHMHYIMQQNRNNKIICFLIANYTCMILQIKTVSLLNRGGLLDAA